MDSELKVLEKAVEDIAGIARGLGLDFYDMRFELCPADILYTFGAYGMPTRFSHWSFGKAFYRMKTQYDYNLSRIYELVINSDPCYAFLLEGNSLVQHKLVIAHVFAHSDFFKHNARFARTNRQMVEAMSVNAQRIRQYEFKYGRKDVEIFLDAVLSIQEHIDPYTRITRETKKEKPGIEQFPETPYDDLWKLGKPAAKPPVQTQVKKTPPEPEKDLLRFIMEHSRELEDWQRDIMSMMREEMVYFWPQMETKIMNEGWAALWHARIIRELDLPEAEALEFAKMHASVLQGSRTHINPYLLGMKIFEDIEKRWENPTTEEQERYRRPGGEGKNKIFEVRETENDVSFLRNYLTREMVEELDLYLYHKVGHDWVIADKNWERVRDILVTSRTNCGFPVIMVEDGDYQHHGELYLRHCYEDVELDIPYLEKTLPYLFLLWGRPVHLETVLEGKGVVFSYDGKRNSRRPLTRVEGERS
ncbi:stage V sporulation protein R [Clostridiales bacterium PH28_bin88]|nr:stage V sporulation protein R [Clostridiales bacterium PH28_bin88]